MSAFPLTRRAALGILALSPAVGVRSALAQPNVRFRNIVVDVSPLRASMGDPTAAWVQQELPGALAQALAGYMARPATATARPWWRESTISISGRAAAGPARGALRRTPSTVRSWSRARMAGTAADAPIRATTSYHPMAVDQPLRVESNHWRVVALAQAFAGWAPRELGL